MSTLDPPAVGNPYGRTLTLNAGANISESVSANSTLQAEHQFQITPRSNSGLAYATPFIMSTTALSPTALDIFPNQTTNQISARSSGNGFAWADICDANFELSANAGNVCRIGIDANGQGTERGTGNNAYVGTRNYSSGQGSKPFDIRVPTNTIGGDATAMRFLQAVGGVALADHPTWTVDPVVAIAKHGGSVVIGSGYELANATTVGFLYLPRMSGAPTGAPPISNGGIYGTGWTSANLYSGQGSGKVTPVVMDETGFKMWANFAGTWKSVTFV